jgi:hypothetical protein
VADAGDGAVGVAFRWQDLGEAEVENLGVAPLGDEDVGGFDVAVDDTFGVGRIERVGDFDAELGEQLGLRGWPEMRCFSVIPSRYSITMKGWPLSSPIS